MDAAPMILVSSGTQPNPMSPQRNVSVLYGQALRQVGCEAVAMLGGDANRLADRFDGLLLSGGGDMAASFFGQRQHPKANPPDILRDEEELELLEAFCHRSKPVFGICRGLQVINVYFGGDLRQHIEGHDDVTHGVQTEPGSRLSHLCGAHFAANSFHHQAVGQLGQGLHSTAYAPDGTIEGLEHDTLPVFGVQWHPERMIAGVQMDVAADHTKLFSFLWGKDAGR